jgi:xylulokinase
MAHDRPQMARAVLEGVALNLRLILDALREASGDRPLAAMRLIGGGARSPLWRQILADVFGLPILLPALVAEATSLGAAIAGGVGVGLYPDFSIAQQFVQTQPACQPDPAAQAVYNRLVTRFTSAYRAVEAI